MGNTLQSVTFGDSDIYRGILYALDLTTSNDVDVVMYRRCNSVEVTVAPHMKVVMTEGNDHSPDEVHSALIHNIRNTDGWVGVRLPRPHWQRFTSAIDQHLKPCWIN